MIMLTQKFRSPEDGKIIAIKVQEDLYYGDQFVLWKHILQSFGDVRVVRAGDMDTHFIVDSKFE
ncbi:hypothetical protein BGX26_011541, partial [Mortierella sp. AD094]